MRSRLSRSQWLALLGIGVLLAAAVLLREERRRRRGPRPTCRPCGPPRRSSPASRASGRRCRTSSCPASAVVPTSSCGRSRPAGVVGVLTRDVRSRGPAFSRGFGMRYPSVVDDDGDVLRAFSPGPPVTVFLDAEGRVVHRRSGAFRDLAEVEALEMWL